MLRSRLVVGVQWMPAAMQTPINVMVTNTSVRATVDITDLTLVEHNVRAG